MSRAAVAGCVLVLLAGCAGKPPCQRDLIFTLQGSALDCATQAPTGKEVPTITAR
jgi:hypothetical protein